MPWTTENKNKINTFLKELGLFILSILKWLVFGNVAIYVATRVINFINDPYMEDEWTSGSYYRDSLLEMFIQTVAFMILFGLVVSMYKLLFKKNYKWQTWTIFVVSLIITLIGVFLS